MKISEITITSVRNIDYLRIKPKTVTALRGNNAVGKTSCLLAIKSVFEGGHDPSLIMHGRDKAEIVITLDVGTVIKRTITRKSSTLTIQDPEGRTIRAPQTFIEELAAGFGLDPLAFVDSPKKDRVKFLLQAIPVRFSSQELAAAGAPGDDTDLPGIEKLRQIIYDQRAEANRLARDAEGNVKELLKAQPEESVDYSAQLEDAEQRKAWAVEQAQEERDAIRQRAIIAGQEVDRDIEARIEALHREKQKRLAEIVQAAADEMEVMEGHVRPVMAALAAEIAGIRERQQQYERSEGIRISIETSRQKVRDCFLKAEELTRVIERLDELKIAKMADLPIPEDVTIKGDTIYRGDTEFDNLNTAAQYLLAIQLCTLKPGALPFFICDKAEHLGDANWKSFLEAAKESGYQVMTARRENQPELTVETFA